MRTHAIALVLVAVALVGCGAEGMDEGDEVLAQDHEALKPPASTGSCTVSSVTSDLCFNAHNTSVAAGSACNRVSGVGLPTVALDEECTRFKIINFLWTAAPGTKPSTVNGMNGMVLGCTDEGTWAVDILASDSPSPTTFQFVSYTWGPNGTKYNVFASCSN